MKNTALLIVFALLLTAASLFITPESRVAQRADYEQYLTSAPFQEKGKELNARIDFWEQKLAAAPGNFVYEQQLAGLYTADFKLSGDIARLHHSDSLLQAVNARIPGQAGVLRSLTANAITRHAFRDAERYIREAYSIGENKFTSALMLADVALERGNLLEARVLLGDIASSAHFDYLIREVKLHDQADDLGKAVRTMAKAAALAKAAGSPSLINWSLSNLADMYGHQGKVRKSYNTYLEALRYDPADLHSLKGIAWIAFSHDDKPEEARRIVRFLQSLRPAPEYHLFLAEMAAYEQDTAMEAQCKAQFLQEASKAVYGNMYKSYICQLKSEGGAASEALKIAGAEVRERPHPMAYHLLAWAAFRNGERERALAILERHVIGQTGEPEALYHAGVILKANGREAAAKIQLQAAREAWFELGPVAAREIEKHLEQL